MSESVETKRVRNDMLVLCRDIGIRVPGSPEEWRGLEYMRDEMAAMGLRRPRIEKFTFDDCAFGDFGGEAIVGKRKVKLQVRPVEYATSTPKGGVEGELVVMDSAARADYGGPELKGKVGLFWGSPMPKLEYLDCLCKSGLAAAINMDHRYHSRWPVSMGYPEMWAKHIRLPIFSLPYEQGWRVGLARKPVRVKLWLRAKRQRSGSGNALADLPGTDPDLRKELIYVSGHMDSVRGSVGASDNASGIAFAMEVARLLAEAPLRRTVRIAGFGVEEKLSVGSFRHYQRRARNGMDRAVFAYNSDSGGTALGVTKLFVTGAPKLRRLVEAIAAEVGYSAAVSDFVCPYSDQFPFNMMNVPSLWVKRSAMAAGDWFFHSAHDNLKAVSSERIAEHAAFAAAFLRRIDKGRRLPFPLSLPRDQWEETREAASDLFRVKIER